MKITDVRCALIGKNPIVRILTDEGLDGLGQIESSKPYVKPHVVHLGELLIGADPTDVERTMLRIRQRGAFKPWGAAVSAIEHALWDLAGKAAGLPVHKLLGGKVRDRVLVYNGNKRQRLVGQTPEDYAESARRMKAEPEKFRIVKQGIAFHSGMKHDVPNFMYGIANPVSHHYQVTRGLLTERGLRHIVECVEAMKEVLGEDVGLALDCGPGFVLPDAIRLAKALEHLNILWLEDTLTGDYIPFVDPDVYRELTVSTTIPIHTGEQIYLRNNFKALIETNAVRIVGPDPCDVGGIAELKWVAEHAALHGVLMAPHGTLNGVIGLAALVQVCATLPDNYIAFEYPTGDPEWWYDIVDGIPTVEDGTIAVGTRPGLGVTFRIDEAKRYLLPEDAAFFD